LSVSEAPPGALSCCRVLDLTEGPLSLCGKLLADFGADVIKIEKPGGDDSRRIGPFHDDDPNPERSLFWWAYNVNKRGVTLNLEAEQGRGIFRELVRSADFVIESFVPGHLQGLGLGYETLAALNPRLVQTSITPFGQSGPKSRNPWCDLTVWASSGAAYITGDRDRSPLCMGFPAQITAQAATEAMTATLIAHYERETSGLGQQVDLSLQESGIGILQATVEMWDLARHEYMRSGGTWVATSGAARRLAFPCRDGYAILLQGGGGSVRMVQASQSLVAWMDEEGLAPDWLKSFDWVNGYNADNVSQDTVDRIEACIAPFLLTKTKKEIYREGWNRGIMIAPVNTLEDIAHDEQLAARGFWEQVWHPELGETVTYCGAFAKMSETPLTCRRRPPLIGEHNAEIYGGELGLSTDALATLSRAGTI